MVENRLALGRILNPTEHAAEAEQASVAHHVNVNAVIRQPTSCTRAQAHEPAWSSAEGRKSINESYWKAMREVSNASTQLTPGTPCLDSERPQ